MKRPGWIKRLLYRLGLRPRSGDLFYSPSLSLTYAFRDARRKAQR